MNFCPTVKPDYQMRPQENKISSVERVGKMCYTATTGG